MGKTEGGGLDAKQTRTIVSKNAIVPLLAIRPPKLSLGCRTRAGCLTPACPLQGPPWAARKTSNFPRPRRDRISLRPPSRPALHRRFRLIQAQLRRSHERRELNLAALTRHANGNRRITRTSLPICAPPQNPKPRWPKDPRQSRTPQQIAERAAPATDTFLSRCVVFVMRSVEALPALPMRCDKVLNLRADSRRA